MTPRKFQMLAVAKALRIYAVHKIQMNSAYTPAAMLRTASNITGKTYKRGAYIEAAADLEALYHG